ncbi:MAG TPA: histidinol dehydrogenase, partial [Nitrososphaera sp.]
MRILSVADPAAEAARLRKASAMLESLFADVMTKMKDVAEYGDKAVVDYTAKFDGVRPDSLAVSKQEIRQAYSHVTKEQIKAVRLMKERLAKSELVVIS